MPRGDWKQFAKDHAGLVAGAFLVAVVALLILEIAGLEHHDLRKDAEKHSENYKVQADHQISLRCPAAPSPSECAQEIENARRDAERDEYDLYAQLVTALWTTVMGIVSILALAISGIGLWALIRTIKQGREANEISREGSVAQRRPWLSVDPVHPADLIWDDGGGAVLKLNIRVTNVGSTAALSVAVSAGVGITNFGFDERRFFEEQCQSLERMAKNGLLAFTLFPNRDETLGRNVTISPGMLNAARQRMVAMYGDIPELDVTTPVIFIGAAYLSTDRRLHVTAFLFHVHRKSDTLSTLAIKPGKNLSTEELNLRSTMPQIARVD